MARDSNLCRGVNDVSDDNIIAFPLNEECSMLNACEHGLSLVIR